MRLRSAALFFLFVMVFTFSRGQRPMTFTIEDLKRPDHLLPRFAAADIWENLILSDAGLSRYQLPQIQVRDPYAIVARSKLPDSLVGYGYHAFFNGMYQAYADHRPFVLSPDMVWLLISQGFARHVIQHAEELRHQFVSFAGKETLTVRDDRIALDNPNSPWEEVFPQFTRQISERTGKELTGTLVSDFSTTTNVSRVASEITIMEAVKPYFNFIVLRIVCGIPQVTLQGTPEDWERLREKAGRLRKYQLDWWIDEIDPLLGQFVQASRGRVDTAFWRNMFKYHSDNHYGAPKIIDGWIVKFFPYNAKGERGSLKEISGMDNLPSEIVKVDLKHISLQAGAAVTTDLELWAGFIGLRQDPKSLALTPEIGWMIRKKDTSNSVLREKMDHDNATGDIMIRVSEVPKEVLGLGHVKSLDIYFIDSIRIPDAIQRMTIDKLRLRGKITDEGVARLRLLFPHTDLYINEKVFLAGRP
jgi:hypothetical protein